MPHQNLDKITQVFHHQQLRQHLAQYRWCICDRSPTLRKKGNILQKMACFLLYFTGRRGHPMWHRANVAMSLICRKSQERQPRKKFYNKCSENSRSQIVFLTDIFRKLTLGVLEYYPDLFSMKPKARSSKVRKFIIIIIIIILFIIIGYSSCLQILRK